MKRRLVRLAVVLAGLAVAGGLVLKLVATPFVVVGNSMAPTLRPLDLCLMKRVRSYQPARGEIVMFRTADEPPLYFIKRVIALPGESLRISDGVVVINDRVLPEPYAADGSAPDLPATNVPPAKVYVMGDNRADSLDAFVATRLVQAKLVGHWRWKPTGDNP